MTENVEESKGKKKGPANEKKVTAVTSSPTNFVQGRKEKKDKDLQKTFSL